MEMGPILTGDPAARFFDSRFKSHDIDLARADRIPIPLEQVSLTPDEIRLLGYFARDLAELSRAAFLRDGPGSLTSYANMSSPIATPWSLKTAATDDELRSFVTIFRRLYMDKEFANFKKAVAVVVKAFGDHPYGAWVAGELGEYETHLATIPQFAPFVQAQTMTFTSKRLLDVFIYTQFAHQPSEDRQRQFNECLSQVHGERDLLTWMFLTEIWKCSLMIGNAGRIIAGWFRHYCDYYGVLPVVLNSLRDTHAGLGVEEKEGDRKARLFGEKVEELEGELWKQAGHPEGGPVQFRRDAQEQLDSALRGGSG